MSHGRSTLLSLIAGGALLLAACSSNGGGSVSLSDEEKEYAEAMAATMTEGGDDEFTLDDDQAECVSSRWVKTFGVDRFQEAGLSPDNLEDDDDGFESLDPSEDEVEELIDAFGDCDVSLSELMVDSMALEADLSNEDRACLEKAFDEEFVAKIMVLGLTQGDDALDGNSELMGEMFQAMGECPEAMSSLGGF